MDSRYDHTQHEMVYISFGNLRVIYRFCSCFQKALLYYYASAQRQ